MVTYCPFDIESDPSRFKLTTRAIETRYGSVAARISKNRSSHTATLYLHGVGADWTTWSPILRAAAELRLETHDQIFIDLPGFGDSENKLGSLQISDVGAMLLSIVSDLGYSRVRIVGHSMGGFLTLDMASRHPEAIESIHLVAGPYFSILKSIQHPFLSFGYSPTVAATFGTQYLLSRTGEFGTIFFKTLYHLGIFRLLLFPFASHPFRLKPLIVKDLCYQQNPRALIQTAANADGYDANKQWGLIKCPIFAVFGIKDRLVPPTDMRRLIRCQPNAVCTMLDDVGHLLHIEQPFEVLTDLRLWA
jgi:pimeloyl-ACP methyl ester carboxylesterase